MKKTLAILAILALTAGSVYADEYSSVQIDKTRLQSAPRTLPGELPEITEVQDLPEYSPVQYTRSLSTASSQDAKLQDALLKIDSAQVDVKNELNLYEAKLADVKNRENLVKQEKNGVMKEIRTIKKKMNALDSAKQKITDNMAAAQTGRTAPKHFNWFK